jgi:hypothetical protein
MTFNGRQLFVLRISIAAIVANFILPPWNYTIDARAIRSEKPAGYYFILEPPLPESSKPMYGVKIDLSRLLIQTSAIFLIAALGIIGVKPRKRKTSIEKQVTKTGDPWTD